MEFDHVFILGDSWKVLSTVEMEEERRLFYVGMSRARETLHLFSLNGRNNPHAGLLDGEYATIRKIPPLADQTPLRRHYELLGLDDLFLDFAGMRPVNHPIRAALHELQAGDLLRAEMRNDQIELVHLNGISVARLSKAAQTRWKDRLQEILEIRVVAMVRRYRKDITDQEYSNKCHGEMWDLPIVEVVWKKIFKSS
jgi:ATP-dependent DNA helicase RecQ